MVNLNRMKIKLLLSTVVLGCLFTSNDIVYAQKAINPIIHADVPDASMIRIGDTYYMSSTTMHMSPGVPIMKSKDLVNWKLVNYAYDTLADMEKMFTEEDHGLVVFVIIMECITFRLSHKHLTKLLFM